MRNRPRGKVMKSTYTAKKTILASSVFLGMAFGTAHAERCYNLAPFSDILRVSALKLRTPGGGIGSTHTLVVGSWIVEGSYVLPIVGSREFELGTTPPTPKRLGFHGTNNTASFGSNDDCVLDGIPGASWTLSCTGEFPAFTNGGSPLTRIPCVGLPPSISSAISSARAAGAPQ